MDKKCSKCGAAKNPREFYKDNNTTDKLRSECKACHKAMIATWRDDNREQYNEYMRVYRRARK